jgi:hypothetical protein
MAESVQQAKHDLREARHVQQERAAAFWQRAVGEGRIIRRSSVLVRRERTEVKIEEHSASQAL